MSTQKIEISTLKEKYNLTQEEQEVVKVFLAERRVYSKALRTKISGICGEKAEYYHLPRIIMTMNFTDGASLMVLNYEKGSGRILSTGINVDEAKDLIEKLKAFVELTTVERQINTYKYKVEKY